MKNMILKKNILLIVLSLFIATSVACDNSKRRTAVSKSKRGGSGSQQQQDDTNNSMSGAESTSLGVCGFVGNMPGMLLRDDGNDDWFVEDIGKFLTAKGDPYAKGDEGFDLGTVSSRCDASTGVRMKGTVEASGSHSFNKNGNNNFNFYDGELLVGIFDSKSQNNNAWAIPVEGVVTGGEVRGNYARVIFDWVERGDDNRITEVYGQIVLEGYYDSEQFKGRFLIMNDKHYNGGTPAIGPIGEFYLPTCNFFRCN
ncbi:MAG: hypothetical protein HOO06_03155 [Bdellovibrionaceae bacterium]|nr:hypothetical protein [Pseudobdellovibrionaceae bacterium]